MLPTQSNRFVRKSVDFSPISYDAFMDYRVGGTEVSAKGKTIIQKLIKGKTVNPDESGLSKREWNELMVAFDLKDKLI